MHIPAEPSTVAEMDGEKHHGGLAAWQQNRVAAFIEENLGQHISLAEVAALVRLSRFHFARAFKRSFGVPPHRYQSERRVSWAKELLAQSDNSITAIALRVGFSETSAFTTAFHRITGLAPSEYRRSVLERLAAQDMPLGRPPAGDQPKATEIEPEITAEPAWHARRLVRTRFAP